MNNFIIRTEEMTDEQIQEFYVKNKDDDRIIDYLNSSTPIILVGSRGVGKSYIFRLAKIMLDKNFSEDKILPVYVTFRKATLLDSSNKMQFQLWMLGRIATETIRAFQKRGILVGGIAQASLLTGGHSEEKTNIEKVCEAFEDSWKQPGEYVDAKSVPSVDDLIYAVEEICTKTGIKRIILFIDEAAHVFIPEQQRQFFTLFRDLRSAFIKCNATVYPGVTSYGNSFESMHDATFLTLNRDIKDKNFVADMKSIIMNQVTDPNMKKCFEQHEENFSLLAYASGGNPRHLMKTIDKSGQLRNNEINQTFREFYREEIWAEHSALAEKYPGNRIYVDWGRNFFENTVLPDLKQKNDKYLDESKITTSYIWMDRDIPQAVKESLRLLEYTGIITEHMPGMRATRNGIGTRYSINLGCLLSYEPYPASTGLNIIKSLSIKRMAEYGASQPIYDSLTSEIGSYNEPNMSAVLKRQLDKSVNELELTEWQFGVLKELGIKTIGDLLNTSEDDLMQARYVAAKRARRMKNAAQAAVYEYLLG